MLQFANGFPPSGSSLTEKNEIAVERTLVQSAQVAASDMAAYSEATSEMRLLSFGLTNPVLAFTSDNLISDNLSSRGKVNKLRSRGTCGLRTSLTALIFFAGPSVLHLISFRFSQINTQ
jgi:hypothetical protein